jgi:hypothetical protein
MPEGESSLSHIAILALPAFTLTGTDGPTDQGRSDQDPGALVAGPDVRQEAMNVKVTVDCPTTTLAQPGLLRPAAQPTTPS